MSSNFFRHFSDRVAGRILCFAGGYVDCVGYLLFKNLFVASITGNVIKAAAITVKTEVITSFIVVSTAYGLGSGIIRFFSIYMKSKKEFHYLLFGIYLFSIELVFLFISMIVGSFLYPYIESAEDVNSWPILVTGSIIAITMGAQVGNAPVAFAQFPNTTGMTASVAATLAAAANVFAVYSARCGLISFYLTYAEEEALQVESHSKVEIDINRQDLLISKTVAAWDELDRQGWPLISFTLGAAIGAIISKHMKLWSLFVPQIIVLFLIIEIVLLYLKENVDNIKNTSRTLVQRQPSYKTFSNKVLDKDEDNNTTTSATTVLPFSELIPTGYKLILGQPDDVDELLERKSIIVNVDDENRNVKAAVVVRHLSQTSEELDHYTSLYEI